MAKADSRGSVTTDKSFRRRAFGYVVTAVYETAHPKQPGAANTHSIELTPDTSDVSYSQGTIIRLGVEDGPIPLKPGTRVNLIIEPAD